MCPLKRPVQEAPKLPGTCEKVSCWVMMGQACSMDRSCNHWTSQPPQVSVLWLANIPKHRFMLKISARSFLKILKIPSSLPCTLNKPAFMPISPHRQTITSYCYPGTDTHWGKLPHTEGSFLWLTGRIKIWKEKNIYRAGAQAIHSYLSHTNKIFIKTNSAWSQFGKF